MGYNAFPSFMGTNSVSSSGLEWHNLALYNGKPLDCFSMSSSSSKYHPDDDIFRMHSSSTAAAAAAASAEPLIGLGLGSHNTFLSNAALPSIPVSSTPTKRSRASYQNMQNPCCQVEGCNLDLKSAKDYHRRHRICESHSKSPKVVVGGKERRFCQQCSRFHDLSEFDDKKRSCRRRLSDHNARRRRVQPESVQLCSTGLSSSLYDQRRQNVLLSGLPISLSNPTWENAMSRQAFIGPSKARGLNFQSDEIHSSISNLRMDAERMSSIHGPNPRLLDQCLLPPSTNQSMAPDLPSAYSFLSSNGWSLNEGESSTMDGLVHGNYNTESESHHLSLFQTNSVPVEQVPPVQSVSLHNAASSNQQEYQLFKAPYDSGGFYSSQRYL